MRIDLYLKASRLVKRRTLAQEMCEAGRVLLKNHAAKPAKEVKPGDVITLVFTSKRIELEVLDIPPPSRKIDPTLLFRVIAEKRLEREDDAWTKNPS